MTGSHSKPPMHTYISSINRRAVIGLWEQKVAKLDISCRGNDNTEIWHTSPPPLSLSHSCVVLSSQPSFLQEVNTEVRSRLWPLEAHPAVILGLFLEIPPCDLAMPQHPPPSSPASSSWGINREVFTPLENFFFQFVFSLLRCGGRKLPLWGSPAAWAHACLHAEWFTDVYQEWIDQRQSHDRRSIKHQIKDGNPRAEHKLRGETEREKKIRHFLFFFPFSCLAGNKHIKRVGL